MLLVSIKLTDLDGRKQAATNQYMDQARRLSVAAGPIAGVSWSVSSGPAYAQHYGSFLAEALKLAAMTICSDVTVLQLCRNVFAQLCDPGVFGRTNQGVEIPS